MIAKHLTTSVPRSAPPSSAPTPESATFFNRRVTIRYPASAAVLTGIARKPQSLFVKARIHDISQGGIALVLKHPPKIGETIYLQLTNRILEFTFDLAAVVRHVTPTPTGSYIVGLAFDEQLTLAELAALL
ncbi:MAG: PilZ domain-containing protein [Gemmataceae bacterium]|nr:PilZ domain-containing protein [Gemmataceae bacterium]